MRKNSATKVMCVLLALTFLLSMSSGLVKSVDTPSIIKFENTKILGASGYPHIEGYDILNDSGFPKLDQQMDVDAPAFFYVRINHTACWSQVQNITFKAWYDEGDDVYNHAYEIHNTSHPGGNINMLLEYNQTLNYIYGENLGLLTQSTTQFQGYLQQHPIVPGSLMIFASSGSEYYNLTDAGNGTLYGDGLGNIDYYTGYYDVTFSSGPMTGAYVLAKYKCMNILHTDHEQHGVGESGRTDFSGVLNHYPVINTTVVFTAGSQTLIDDGNGNIIGDGSGNIIYNNGKFSITFNTPPDPGTPIYASYDYQDYYEHVVDELLGIGDGTTTKFGGKLTEVPLLPMSLTVYDEDENEVMIDMGDRQIWEYGGGGSTQGYVNYTDGWFTVTFSTPPAVNKRIYATYTLVHLPFTIYWPDSSEVLFSPSWSAEEILDNYTHEILLGFIPYYQVRWADGDGFTGSNPSGYWNLDDPHSWNFNITVWDVGANNFDSAQGEFGFYKYTRLTVSNNPSGSGAPGGDISPMKPWAVVDYSANCPYKIWTNISDLTTGPPNNYIMPLESIWVMGGQLSSPTQFQDGAIDDGVSEPIYLYGDVGTWYEPCNDGYKSNGTAANEDLVVMWYVKVPPGQPEGTYSTQLTYVIEHI